MEHTTFTSLSFLYKYITQACLLHSLCAPLLISATLYVQNQLQTFSCSVPLPKWRYTMETYYLHFRVTLAASSTPTRLHHYHMDRSFGQSRNLKRYSMTTCHGQNCITLFSMAVISTYYSNDAPKNA